MAGQGAAHAKGRCPECGRVISGRATGIEAEHADRRWVLLAPHVRQRGPRNPVTCLPPGGYRKVPRVG